MRRPQTRPPDKNRMKTLRRLGITGGAVDLNLIIVSRSTNPGEAPWRDRLRSESALFEWGRHAHRTINQYLTATDVVEPRRLYASPEDGWPSAIAYCARVDMKAGLS